MSPDLAYISSTLKGATAKMTLREKSEARECFEHWRSECQRIGPNPPEVVAHTVHAIIDERMQHMLATSVHGPDVQCRKGCASCCRLQVDVYAHEAELLHLIARVDGIEIDAEKLARQASMPWHQLPIEDRRCLFLSADNECRVYEHRPGACRKYMVKSEPDLCDMDKHPGGEVAIVFSMEAEIISSAAMTVYGADNMAAMLLKTRG